MNTEHVSCEATLHMGPRVVVHCALEAGHPLPHWDALRVHEWRPWIGEGR